ncbi:MAG: hypothetical protein ACP5M9_02950 [Candidatus Micrarchaeia archaeon]
MDLLSKTAIIAVIFILIVFLLYYLQSAGVFGSYIVTKAQAETLVLNDLQNTFQGAQINITNVSASQYQGSWHIIASVVQNATTPCPDYGVYSFDYPKYNFVYKVENIYTQNCVLYQKGLNQGDIIGSYPAAITQSYDANISSINNFVSKYGFSNVSVTAKYFNTTVYEGKKYKEVWVIDYTALKSNYSVYALLYGSNGSVATVYNSS